MRKCFYASLAVLALIASTGAAAQSAVSEPSTWRWTATKALDAQRSSEKAGETALAVADFRQNYERYSSIGMLENGR